MAFTLRLNDEANDAIEKIDYDGNKTQKIQHVILRYQPLKDEIKHLKNRLSIENKEITQKYNDVAMQLETAHRLLETKVRLDQDISTFVDRKSS